MENLEMDCCDAGDPYDSEYDKWERCRGTCDCGVGCSLDNGHEGMGYPTHACSHECLTGLDMD